MLGRKLVQCKLYVRPENPSHRFLSLLHAADLHPQQVIKPAAGECVLTAAVNIRMYSRPGLEA